MIGRRLSELLGLKTKLEPKTEFSILFSGQLKHQGELAAFEIPTLCRPIAFPHRRHDFQVPFRWRG